MRIVGYFGFGTTVVLIALITLTPQSATSAHSSVSRQLLACLHRLGVPHSFGPTQWELVANIIMFVPLGFFFALLAGRWAWGGLALLPLISIAIEVSQYLFLPSRYPSLQDVFANSTGGWIGLLLGMGLVWVASNARGPQTVA